MKFNHVKKGWALNDPLALQLAAYLGIICNLFSLVPSTNHIVLGSIMFKAVPSRMSESSQFILKKLNESALA